MNYSVQQFLRGWRGTVFGPPLARFRRDGGHIPVPVCSIGEPGSKGMSLNAV